ncbi:MAG: nucleoside-3/5-monophosphate phosphatase and short-chain exopolyphosphatase SurE [Pseudomonadota bacterium]
MTRILISNDDGVHAYGLPPLIEALTPLGEVWVVAPESEQSAQSHALTMHKPLRVRRRGERFFGVSGTPADCVYMALNKLMPERPDIVVSGINRGGNIGNDILYSGTVAAAMEACLVGIPAIAISLHVDWEVHASKHHWGTAAALAARLVGQVRIHGLLPRTLLNVNVPDVPPEALKRVAATSMGVRRYENKVDERVDPRGQRYYWLGGAHERFDPIPDSDGQAIERGYASVTPIQADLTSWPGLARVHRMDVFYAHNEKTDSGGHRD